MVSMRQRLLLVAGWIAAAVGAGVVASGAVAVAGGQVLDRPLRPLTAAEVAALPVVEVGTPDAFEPHASGGFVSTTGAPPQGSEDDVDGRDDPTGAGGSSASDGLTATEPDPIDLEAGSVVEVVSADGGQASFALASDTLLLLWATPRPGYVATLRSEATDRITIAFTSSLGVWVIEAAVEDDVIVTATRPEPLA